MPEDERDGPQAATAPALASLADVCGPRVDYRASVIVTLCYRHVILPGSGHSPSSVSLLPGRVVSPPFTRLAHPESPIRPNG